jgi:hypothetical protein
MIRNYDAIPQVPKSLRKRIYHLSEPQPVTKYYDDITVRAYTPQNWKRAYVTAFQKWSQSRPWRQNSIGA